MNKTKKNMIGICAGAFCICVAFAQSFSSDENAGEDLWVENVEALTNSEFNTQTTWRCSGLPITVTCKIKCGVCGTGTEGAGILEGKHSCNVSRP